MRASFCPSDKLGEIVQEHGQELPVYKSVFLYPEEDLETLITFDSVKKYYGKRTALWIPIDIDIKRGTDANVLERTATVCRMLMAQGLSKWNFVVWYSGRGYHVDIHADCFALEPSEQYPFLIKDAIAKLIPEYDASIYTRSAVIRAPYSINAKSGRYKTNLNIERVLACDLEYVMDVSGSYEKAIKQVEEFISEEYCGNGELSHLIDVSSIKKTEAFVAKNIAAVNDEPKMTAACIGSLWNMGPQKGERHHAVMRMASHFKRSGFPSMACKAALKEWVAGGLDDYELYRLIDNTYNSGYKYSCKDEILRRHCKVNCNHYKNKDYENEILSQTEIVNRIKEFYSEDFAKNKIELAPIFGLSSQLNIYPSELVTLMGPTGTNKTALVHNIVLGFNMMTREIMTKYHTTTDFYALELDEIEMYVRTLMIVSGRDREYVINNIDEVQREFGHLCSHINFYTTPPSFEELEERIRKNNPKKVVIDYFDTFLLGIDGKDEGAAKAKRVYHTLQSIGVKYKIIFLVVSQIRREDARNGAINIYSGVGTGAIENASRKVFEISGEQQDNIRNIRLLKDNMGQRMNYVKYVVEDSYRLVRY